MNVLFLFDHRSSQSCWQTFYVNSVAWSKRYKHLIKYEICMQTKFILYWSARIWRDCMLMLPNNKLDFIIRHHRKTLIALRTSFLLLSFCYSVTAKFLVVWIRNMFHWCNLTWIEASLALTLDTSKWWQLKNWEEFVRSWTGERQKSREWPCLYKSHISLFDIQKQHMNM